MYNTYIHVHFTVHKTLQLYGIELNTKTSIFKDRLGNVLLVFLNKSTVPCNSFTVSVNNFIFTGVELFLNK